MLYTNRLFEKLYRDKRGLRNLSKRFIKEKFEYELQYNINKQILHI
jgi:hypothetical protein